LQVEAFNFQGQRFTNLDVIKKVHYENFSIFLVIDGFKQDEAVLTRQHIEQFVEELFRIVTSSTGYSQFMSFLKQLDKSFNASVSFLWLEKDKCHVGFCGDCRVYLNGNLKTVDHTHAWKMCSRKIMNPNVIGELCITHPYQNVLSKTIKDHECEIIDFDLQSGDEIFIITDGGWQHLHQKIINKECNPIELCNEFFNDNASGYYIKI